MRVMAKYLCAVAFGIGLAVTSSAHAMEGYSDPFVGDIYHLVSCTQHAGECAAFNATNGPPPADYLNGFNQEAFRTYYESEGYHPTEDFSIEITGFNSSGVVYGRVLDGGIAAFDTQFIFYRGGVSCCIIDFPFVINDLNDNGYFVGMNADGFGYVTLGIVPDAAAIYSVPTFDPTSQAILDSFSFPWSWDFLAIDNNNTILAEYYDQRYLFVPKALIPEPGSSMVITGLIVLFLFRKRRSRTFPTAG